MITIADQIVLEALTRGERQILSDPDSWVPIIFGKKYPNNADVISFLRKAASDQPEDRATFRIKKYLGFPSHDTQLPAWAITIGGSSETRKGIGGVYEDGTPHSSVLVPGEDWISYGAIYETSVNIGCYAANPQLTTYLAAIAHFILLHERETLEIDSGCMVQRIGVMDLMASPEQFPVFTFVRQVVFTCEVPCTWEEKVYPLAEINIAATVKDTNENIIGVQTTVTPQAPSGAITGD